jgi:hypothetical protein
MDTLRCLSRHRHHPRAPQTGAPGGPERQKTIRCSLAHHVFKRTKTSDADRGAKLRRPRRRTGDHRSATPQAGTGDVSGLAPPETSTASATPATGPRSRSTCRDRRVRDRHERPALLRPPGCARALGG